MQEYLTTHTEHGHESGHWNQPWGSVTQDLEVSVHVMSVLSAFASLVDSESSIYIPPLSLSISLKILILNRNIELKNIYHYLDLRI